MNDIGGSWDRRGEFLVNYDANTKDLKVPCEVTVEYTSKTSDENVVRKLNSTELETITTLFNDVAGRAKSGSPTTKKADKSILAAEESIKQGVEATFTHDKKIYKITPLQPEDSDKLTTLKDLATRRNENIHFVTVNPNTQSSKRVSVTASLSQGTSPSATASPSKSPKSSIPHSDVSKRLSLVGWVKLDRYLGFRDGRQIENNFFEVKVNNTIITDTKELESVEKELSNIANSTNQSTKALSNAMRQGKDVEIPIGNKIYQFVHVNHSDHEKTPEKESQKIFDLKAARENWLQTQPVAVADPLPYAVQQFLQTSKPQTSSTVILTQKSTPPPRPPLPPKNSQLSQSVSRVSSQILPRGTVERAAPPIPPASIERTGSRALPPPPMPPAKVVRTSSKKLPADATERARDKPLPTPPASKPGSAASSPGTKPSNASSPTAAPRSDLWNDKKTTALLDKFILFNESIRPIRNKDVVAQILKDHYDNLSRDARAQFDASLGENEVIKFGEYSLIPKK